VSISGDGTRTPTGRTTVDVCADAADVDHVALWRLLSTPALWSTWAPHIRHAGPEPADDAAQPDDAGGGDGAVRPGDLVRIHGYGPVAVTARIALVDPPRRWDFLVALPLGHQLTATHELVDHPSRVCVRMALHGPLPSPLASTLLRVYQPLAAVAVHRLVARASQPDRPMPADRTEHAER
jgi:hypothetical protein